MASKRDLTETEASQNQKEVTINDRDQELEDSVNAVLAISVSASFLISNANFMAATFFELNDGGIAAAFNMRLPSQGTALDTFSRKFTVRNNTDEIATIMVDPAGDGADGDTVTCYPSQIVHCQSDGTNVIEVPGLNGIWPSVEITGTARTIGQSDRGKALWSSNINPVVFTIPEWATTPLPIGMNWRAVQLGVGALEVTASGSATIIANGISDASVFLAGFGAGCVLWQYEEDLWLAEGNIM